VYINPLDVSEIDFAERIYYLENKAFGPTNMAMPRWVFYDCAVVPGFIAGYAMRTSSLTPAVREVMSHSNDSEWTPLSLFIIIPTMAKGEWVAHNLCSINSLLPKEERFYGLGFISKAFGLWYANVETCCGITQWMSPSMKLHTHYGDFEILTSYTPVHSYPRTLTYRLKVDTRSWMRFFSREENGKFGSDYEYAEFEVDPKQDESLKGFQARLQKGEGPFFLNAEEVAAKALDEKQRVYRPR
jgi:hypothetical protein